ncbi:MAG TPA: hypothetical protein VFG04_13810 [Planctomycetaceae bacterium]|jgi:hypothetical protein|nr:hypothetical protein [Planctomycetaceae bacterium]
MPMLRIECTVDGTRVGLYEFDCSHVSNPQKLTNGPITIHFDPKNDYHHQMEINSLPPRYSSTIKGNDPGSATK